MVINYFKAYPKQYLRFTATVLVVLWIFSVFLSYLYQISTNTVCGFRLYVIFFCGLLYWVGMSPAIVSLTTRWKNNYPLKKQLARHALTGTALVSINQLVIPVCISSALQLFFGCADSNSSVLANALTNNILVNVLIYSLLTGMVYWNKKAPVNIPFFEQPVTPGEALMEEKKEVEDINYPATIAIKSGNITELVPAASIYWIQANQNCVHIYNGKKKYVQYSSLKKFQHQLDPAVFVQVHRSAVVNRNCIKEIINSPSGDGQLVLQNDTVVKFSRHYKKNLG
jgi:hypothetical protein